MSLIFFFVLLLKLSTISSTTITLPIHRHVTSPHHDELTHLAALTAASLARAGRLKHRKASPTHAPLTPHSYGGYSIPISIGTPPQSLPLLLDTGSSLTWTPCTTAYRCTRCASPSNPRPHLASFLPKSSASARLAGCRNPKCIYVHPETTGVMCPADCTTRNCTRICPPYVTMYGSGSTAGLLMFETLLLAGHSVPGFAIGCSVYSDRQPAGGIAGFGRGPISLPSQLGVSKFAYCLISRSLDDDKRHSGTLVLDPAASSGISFTNFAKNPAHSTSTDYYYLQLRRISVGGKKVKIPYTALVTNSAGHGGVIIDSGTTVTFMSPAIFNPLLEAFVEKVGDRYKRSIEAERLTGLRPCFILPENAEEVQLPELVLQFKGGAEMRLPLENYFAFAGRSQRTACLTVVSDGGDGEGEGPAMIIGSFQQQNYYVVYDLEKGKFGFRQQSCLAP